MKLIVYSAERDNIEKSKTRKYQVALTILMKIKHGDVVVTCGGFFDLSRTVP